MSDPSRYHYHASTIGAWWQINRPFQEIVPVQASVSLPGTGGFGTARAERLDFRGLLAFESIESLVAGSYDKDGESYDSTATVTIAKLNVMSLVTADRVVARVATSSPVKGPLRITPIGSYFENLRIGGYPIEPELATDRFCGCESLDDVRAAFEVARLTLEEFDAQTKQRTEGQKNRLTGYFSRFWTEDPAAGPKTTVGSLIRGIKDAEGLPEELRPVGHVIHVPGFGCIRLAELQITDSSLSLTMFQADMGSGVGGSGGAGTASGGGGSDP